MRIIAGSARGRSYDAPEGQDTRPTLVRVRKSLFDALQFRLPGAKVLDLFSGSGGLGLEAASRGAASVICNDRDRACAQLIRRNAEKTGLADIIDVWQYDCMEALAQAERRGLKFDLILIDAPYFEKSGEKCAEEVFVRQLLQTGGIAVLEHDVSVFAPEVDKLSKIVWERNYGDVVLTMLGEDKE